MEESLYERINAKTTEFLSSIGGIEIAKVSKESINGQIEAGFGFNICNKRPEIVDDIFTSLDFKSPCLDLVRMVFSAEYVEIENISQGNIVHSPDEEDIRGFFTCLVNDVKLQMLEKSIENICDYFGSHRNITDKTLKRIKSELFYSKDEFIQKYFSVMGNKEIWGKGFDEKKLKGIIEKSDLHTVIPKINFLWGCYKFTRLVNEGIIQKGQSFDALKYNFKLRNLSKVKTLNNNVGEDILYEQEQFIHFVTKLYEINSKERKNSITIENMNKSLNLQIFNESTRLMDIYLTQFMVDTYKYLKANDHSNSHEYYDRFKINGEPAFDYYIDTEDEKIKGLKGELELITSFIPIKYNNLKLFLFNFEHLSEELNILENISSQKLISIIESMASYLQRYIENAITASNLYQKLNMNCSKLLANQVLIYEYLKDFEPNKPTIKDLYGSFAEYELNEIVYFSTYSKAHDHLKYNLDVCRNDKNTSLHENI
ncbi:MAG: hypothetical protein ACOYVK_13800 [Bacillota bacterium]